MTPARPADGRRPVVLGRIGAPFGVQGWVKVQSFTDPPEGIVGYGTWELTQGGHAAGSAVVLDWKRAGSAIAVRLEGVGSRDEAQALSFFKGKGCPTCNTIGYRGRRAIFEAIPASAEVRSALELGRPAKEIEAAAIESGMITVRERALALVREGVTTFDEFARLRL